MQAPHSSTATAAAPIASTPVSPAPQPDEPSQLGGCIKRTGVIRLVYAAKYSLQGLQFAWAEAAFRQEAIVACIMCPAAFWLGRGVLERCVLLAMVVLVLIVEILNTAIESVCDRIGTQYHGMSQRAKDLGSAAVFLSLVLCFIVWLAVALDRLST